MGSAQQSSDLNDWKNEYAKRIESTLNARRAQKPTFEKDVQTTNPDFIVYIPKVEPEKLGDCYNDHFQVFESITAFYLRLLVKRLVKGR